MKLTDTQIHWNNNTLNYDTSKYKFKQNDLKLIEDYLSFSPA